LVVDTRDDGACYIAAERLIADTKLRVSIRRAGMEVAASFPPEQAALNLLEALWGGE
jgi:hypothetical protein